MIFRDRQEAGKKLFTKLLAYKDHPNAIVLALPRGGVVIGFEIAQGLNLPLDIVVTRKIRAPSNPELAIGAITEDGRGIFYDQLIEACGISSAYISKEIKIQKKEALRRLKLYRSGLPILNLQDKIILLVDDGIATGATMRAAIAAVKNKKPAQIIIVAPVTAPNSYEKIRHEADEVIVLDTPDNFMAVGQFYQEFPQTSDEEVMELMKKARLKL